MAPRSAWVALALLVGRAAAEVYEVEKEDVAPYSLAAKHLFYVDATPKGHHGRGSALAHDGEGAQVLFEDFRVTSASLGETEELASLQVGLLPWEHFNELVDSNSFCGPNAEVLLKDVPMKTDAKIMPVPSGKTVTKQMKISTTGVYVVFLSNCGKWQDLQISGTISVKGMNGFLPANRRSSLTLSGWCLALYIIAGMAWVVLLASNKKELHEPHYAIASFIAFGVGEAACNWFFLSEMDRTGTTLVWLEKLCQSMTIMKSAYMFAVIMLLAFGVGLTQAEEYANLSWKLLGVTTVFSASLAPKVCILDYRQTKNLSEGDVMLAMIPVVLVTIASTGWGAKGLAKTMERCKEFNYDDTLKLLHRLVVMVMLLMVVAACVMLAQVFDKPGRGEAWWGHHMFWSETVGQLIHMSALVALMVLCKPDQTIFMASAYTPSQGVEGELKGVPCAAEEEDCMLDNAEDEERGPTAQTIGSSAGVE